MACTILSLVIVFTFVIVLRFVVDKAEKIHRRRRAHAITIEPPHRHC